MGRYFTFLRNLIQPSKKVEEGLGQISTHDHKQFTYESLLSATDRFHPKNFLGQGGFGPVFKGTLADGRVVAVKKLSNMSKQGKKEYENETKLLACVQHRNVVTLFGYCSHDTEMLLVYEYVANVSLDKFLFSSSKDDLRDWNRRQDIITGVARGLLYLHDHAHKRIIHRDIKASNILLDENWLPKVADFGMARLFSSDESSVHTRLAGTTGYMAPEYAMHGILSVKADVFSFGVVVLELVTGQRNSPPIGHYGGDTLLEKMYDLHMNARSLEMVDPRMEVAGAGDVIKQCIHVALLCTQGDPSLRPEMSRVVLLLSKRSSNMEQPTLPGIPGVRRRRSSKARIRPDIAGTSGSSDSSSSKTETLFTSSGNTTSNSDARGKRPMHS